MAVLEIWGRPGLAATRAEEGGIGSFIGVERKMKTHQRRCGTGRRDSSRTFIDAFTKVFSSDLWEWHGAVVGPTADTDESRLFRSM